MRTPSRFHKPWTWNHLHTLSLMVALVLWSTLPLLRTTLIESGCAKQADLCKTQELNALDRWAVVDQDYVAGRISDYLQNTSGVLAFALPLLWLMLHSARGVSSAIRSGGIFRKVAWDWLVILHAVAWSGAATESAKILSQRPRPFVYFSPQLHEHAHSAYTSFYSGHTSFAAACGMAAWMMLVAHDGSLAWRRGGLALYGILMISTGIARVKAGVHFPTDVLAGACFGSVISYFVMRQHLSNKSKNYFWPAPK